MNFPPQNISGLPLPDKASAEHSRKLVENIQQVIAKKGGVIPFSEYKYPSESQIAITTTSFFFLQISIQA
jgi:hypothetical protein